MIGLVKKRISGGSEVGLFNACSLWCASLLCVDGVPRQFTLLIVAMNECSIGRCF
jgi:hypothetical protein